MKIVCYGDSNTWGYNSLTGIRHEKPYPTLLQEALPQDLVINEGLNGRTTVYDDPYDDTRNGLKDIRRCIKTHLPIDVLVIMLGTNDAKRMFQTTPLSFQKSMRSLLYKAIDKELYRSGYGQPKILVVSPPRMHSDYFKNEDTKITFGEQGYEVMESAASCIESCIQPLQEYDIDFLDTTNICMAQDIDGIHMDQENHEKLAKAILERIQTYK